MLTPPDSPLTKGAVGGDKGCAAAEAIFRRAVDTDMVSPVGDMIKKRKPTTSIAASTIVMGLVVRRTALGRAIGYVGVSSQDARGIWSLADYDALPHDDPVVCRASVRFVVMWTARQVIQENDENFLL